MNRMYLFSLTAWLFIIYVFAFTSTRADLNTALAIYAGIQIALAASFAIWPTTIKEHLS